MNKLIVAAVALGLSTSIVGCKKESETKEAAAQPAATQTADQMEATSAGKGSSASASKGSGTPAASGLESEGAKAGYAIGFSGGEAMKRDLAELDVESFMNGFNDAFSGKEPVIPKAEMQAAIQTLQAKKMEEMKQKAEVAKTENKGASDKFLAENKAKEGVITTDSGLQYEIIKSGDGKASPTAEDTVKVHYHGTLIDGTVFDSSVDRGEPASFGVGQVIKGWTEALQLMKAGDKWKLTIPSDLAYGERGAGGRIGPNAALVFDVELLEIVKK